MKFWLVLGFAVLSFKVFAQASTCVRLYDSPVILNSVEDLIRNLQDIKVLTNIDSENRPSDLIDTAIIGKLKRPIVLYRNSSHSTFHGSHKDKIFSYYDLSMRDLEHFLYGETKDLGLYFYWAKDIETAKKIPAGWGGAFEDGIFRHMVLVGAGTEILISPRTIEHEIMIMDLTQVQSLKRIARSQAERRKAAESVHRLIHRKPPSLPTVIN